MACLAVWHYVQCDIGNWNHIAIAIAICSDVDDACIKERERVWAWNDSKKKTNKEKE